jgi:hypothetical protein
LSETREARKVSRATSPALRLPVVHRKVLVEPYAGTGKGLKPDMDNAVAVVTAAVIAVAVIAVPTAAAVSIG